MQTGGPEDVAWAEAFTQVVRYCAENNKQITITDLCEKLKRHFGEDVILTGIRGKRNVVTSRSSLLVSGPNGMLLHPGHPYWYQGQTECCYIPVNC